MGNFIMNVPMNMCNILMNIHRYGITLPDVKGNTDGLSIRTDGWPQSN